MTKLPDFNALFYRTKIAPLRFRARNTSCLPHEIQYLSGYLHDATFNVRDITTRGKTLTIPIDRECWEFGFTDHKIDGEITHHELYITKTRLTVSCVQKIVWETSKPDALMETRMIESVYLGPERWETDDTIRLIITSPHQGWRMNIYFDKHEGAIRLTDLESPYLFSSRNP